MLSLSDLTLDDSPPSFEPYAHIKKTPLAGRSLFASTPIPASTLIWTCPDSFAWTFLPDYKREICSQCFKYDGSRWRFKAHSPTSKRVLRVFCSVECHARWSEVTTEIDLEAIDAVDGLLKAKNEVKKATHFDKSASPGAASSKELASEWEAAAKTAAQIVRMRQEAVKHPSKARKLLHQATVLVPALHQDDDDDVLVFFLHGIIKRSHDEAAYRQMLSLQPTNIYLGRHSGYSTLQMHIRMFMNLVMHLPLALLPCCDVETVTALATRDAGNSFGVWAEGGYMIAYGLYPSASYFNHSCKPNVARSRKAQGMEFKTLQPMELGQELLISYLGEPGSDEGHLTQRRQKLKKGWGFLCRCERCREEEGEGT